MSIKQISTQQHTQAVAIKAKIFAAQNTQHSQHSQHSQSPRHNTRKKAAE